MKRQAIPISVVLFASAVWLVAAPGENRPDSPPGLPRSVSVELGREIFFNETFAGNGRTCGTCHEPRAHFAVTPALAQARFTADPEGPLFRAIDSDEGDGTSYSIVLESALFVVNLQLHPDVRLADAPLQRVLQVRRSVPAITNLALTAPYQWDGRLGDLLTQGQGAVDDHFEAGRQPTQRELHALVRFQESLFSPHSLESLTGEDDIPLDLDSTLEVFSAAAVRGRQHFKDHCTTCHAGVLGTEATLPAQGQFHNTFVSKLNRPGLPLFNLIFRNSDGTETQVLTPDPGLAATTGQIIDLDRFETQQLRAIRHTAPYFHDNSAATLQEVVDHYNLTFGFGLAGRRKDELIAFLETL